jgi:hypothetical protein
MYVAGELTADQQPVTALRRVRVEELSRDSEIHARATTLEKVPLRGVLGGQTTDVNGIEDEVDGRQVLVEGDDLLGHCEELGWIRRHEVAHGHGK